MSSEDQCQAETNSGARCKRAARVTLKREWEEKVFFIFTKKVEVFDRFCNQQIIADRCCDCYAKQKRAQKVCNSSQEQGYPWASGPGRNHGGHDIGAIVHAVEEVEDQGQPDENDDQHCA